MITSAEPLAPGLDTSFPAPVPTTHTRTAFLAIATAVTSARQSVDDGDSDILDRVRAEFLEMPGLSPTRAQAARLFGVPEDRCVPVLEHCVVIGFLRHAPGGRYRRNDVYP